MLLADDAAFQHACNVGGHNPKGRVPGYLLNLWLLQQPLARRLAWYRYECEWPESRRNTFV